MDFNDSYGMLSQLADKNTATSVAIADKTNKFNADQAKLNRDWQEKMSNSAHAREVEDLKRAGLNPVLSAGGQGAPVGSGASATGQKADVDMSIVPALTNIINTQMNNAASIQAAQIAANASIQSAYASAAASRYAADASRDASRYTADKNYDRDILTKGVSPTGFLYNSGKSAFGTRPDSKSGLGSIWSSTKRFFKNIFK